jgi:DNA-binding NarL/FixJ family response regulator
VLVVSEDPLARSGLLALLSREPGLVATAPAPGASPASAAALADVVVCDLGLGPPGADRLREVLDEAGGVPLVALVAGEAQAAEAAAAGARGVLLRQSESSRLAAGLRAAAEGLTVLDPVFAAAALRPPPGAPARLPEALTPREHEVLQLLAQGLSNRSIGDRLGVSEHTAKFHVNAILGKLGAQTRTEAVVLAARLGLVAL